MTGPDASQAVEPIIQALYQEILDGRNRHSGAAMAASFAEDAEVVGFDGSQVLGRQAIISEMDRSPSIESARHGRP